MKSYNIVVLGVFLWLSTFSMACGCGGGEADLAPSPWPWEVRLELLYSALGVTVVVFGVYYLLSMFQWFNRQVVLVCAALAVSHVLLSVWLFESGAVVLWGFYSADRAMLVQIMLAGTPLLQAACHGVYVVAVRSKV